MAFATSVDVASRLGRDLADGEDTTVEWLLDAATGVIADAAGKTDAWATDLEADGVPKILNVICVELVCRALANPNSLDSLQETVGSYNYNARFREDGGLLLAPHEVSLVRRTVLGSSTSSPRTTPPITEDFGIEIGS